MKYVWGAKVWHTVYGSGPHKLTRASSYVTSCGATIPLGAPTQTDPKSVPASACPTCANFTQAQLQEMRKVMGAPTVTPDPNATPKGPAVAAQLTTAAKPSAKRSRQRQVRP